MDLSAKQPGADGRRLGKPGPQKICVHLRSSAVVCFGLVWGLSGGRGAQDGERFSAAAFDARAADAAEAAFAPDQFEDRTECLKQICAEASLFGHYSLLRRMADALEGSRKADAAEVKKALEIRQI